MAAAVAIGQAVGYTSAGTVEFLVDGDGRFYFLEMNTRLQVEHPITEAVTGLDFVRAQIEIADRNSGRVPASHHWDETGTRPLFRGHAIECRIYAEDPDEGFLPSPGRITHLRTPAGPWIRVDSGAFAGWVVPTTYDPLISKVIAWAPDREGAVARMLRALMEYDLRGIKTTIGFCRWLLDTPAFRAGDFDTTTVDRMLESAKGSGAGAPVAIDPQLEGLVAVAAALYAHARASLRRPAPIAAAAEGAWVRQARMEALRG
jgi:acetyl-CoA carboxylase biotin carboxylase subunit